MPHWSQLFVPLPPEAALPLRLKAAETAHSRRRCRKASAEAFARLRHLTHRALAFEVAAQRRATPSPARGGQGKSTTSRGPSSQPADLFGELA